MPVLDSRVWLNWFYHPSSSFVCAMQADLEVFREDPEKNDKSFFIGYSLRLHLRDRVRASGRTAPGREVRALRRATSCAAHPTGVECDFARPRLPRFVVPRAASPLESGLPGASTPGIFRPWPFSSLRRITPPDGSPVLFRTDTTYRIQRTRTIDIFLRS